MKKIKVFLFDEQEIFLAGLKLKLKLFFQEIEIIGDATNYAQLEKKLSLYEIPDILIFGNNLPDNKGIKQAQSIKQKPELTNVKIIIISAYSSCSNAYHNYELITEAIDLGLSGYLLKDSKIEDILIAIRMVMTGESFVIGNTIDLKELNTEILEDRKRLQSFLKKQTNFRLTCREIEVIKLISEGYSSKQIGSHLGISEEAVTNHKDNIKLKLKEQYNINIKNVVDLIVWAIRNRIIQL